MCRITVSVTQTVSEKIETNFGPNGPNIKMINSMLMKSFFLNIFGTVTGSKNLLDEIFRSGLLSYYFLASNVKTIRFAAISSKLFIVLKYVE